MDQYHLQMCVFGYAGIYPALLRDPMTLICDVT